jgi:hypothetical protein
MLLCSPVLVSLCLHLLSFFDLLFFSTREPQPFFTISLSCCTHPCAFYAFSFYALYAIFIQCTIPLLCISAAELSSFYTPESLSTAAPHLFSILHTYILCAPCACYPTMLSHVEFSPCSLSPLFSLYGC